MLALPTTPSHLLKAFLRLIYLGSTHLTLQSLPHFLSLIQLLNVEGIIEPPELNVQTRPTPAEVLGEKPIKSETGAELVAEQFAKVGLEIPKGIVFKEETGGDLLKSAESGEQLLGTNFPHKVVFKEGLVDKEEERKDSNVTEKKFVTNYQMNGLPKLLPKERSFAKLQKPLKPHFCNQCNFNTDSLKMFKNHNLYKHQERGALCDQCDKRFFTNEHLQNHINTIHYPTTHSCSSCSFKTGTKRQLVVHVQRNHNEKHLLCSECSYVCSDAGFLQMHIGRHHTDKTLWPQCKWPECNYTSWPKKNVETHYKKVHEGIRYKCNICSKTFTARANMHAHKLKIHQDLLKSDNRSKTTTRASFDARYTFEEDNCAT